MPVIKLTDKDVQWPFNGDPAYKLGKGWGTREAIDPTPCYAHDEGIIRNALEIVMNRTIPLDVTYYIGSHEGTSRTNAWAMECGYYDYSESEEGEYKKDNIVYIHGKRIPPHPSITRYLVAHEYGHHIEYMLNKHFDLKDGQLKEIYKEFRGLQEIPYYGAGTWHKAPGEVFACDFRHILAEVETEFWPHPGIPRPDYVDKVVEWWRTLLLPKEEWKLPK